MSLADNFSTISFSKNSITTSSVSSFSFSFTLWIRRQFLLEYCSWQSRPLFIVSTFSFQYFTSFFRSKICRSFSFLSASISLNFSLMNFMDSLNSSTCLAPLIWVSFVEKESSKMSFTFFSKFCNQLYKKPAQRGDSIPSSKISLSSLLSDVFKLLSLTFFLSWSSFDLSLKSRFCLSKKLLIVVLIFKISLKCKNKVTCVISVLFYLIF